MKKILYSLMTLVVALTAVSCQKDDDIKIDNTKKVDTPAKTVKAEAGTVTVMYYGAGGGNLDSKQIRKMRQCASIGATDKVNMTFEYKFSKKWQNNSEYANYHGVLRMDLADAASLKGCKVYNIKDENIPSNLENLPLKQYSDNAALDMANPDEISNFIKWSAQKHPADKYVLIMANHGGGWNIRDDESETATTRAVIFDDNLTVNKMKRCDSAKNIVDGINNSGVKLEVLYMDACVMSVWENLYEYKQAPVRYVVSSNEVSKGGNYEIMFNEIIKTPTDLRTSFVNYIDQHMANNDKYALNYNDMGIYDLSEIARMTPLINEICDSLKNQMASKYNAISSNASSAMRLGLLQANQNVRVSSEMGQMIVNTYKLYEGVSYDKISNSDEYRLSANYVQLFWKNHEDLWDACSEQSKEDAVLKMMNQGAYCVTLGDILKAYSDNWSSYKGKDRDIYKASSARLYNTYISMLKEIAYINCSHKTFADQPYIETSPAVTVMAMNDKGWKAWKYNEYTDFNSIYMARNYDLQTAISLYAKSTFAKETRWGEVLKVNPFNPSPLSNDSRMTRYYKK